MCLLFFGRTVLLLPRGSDLQVLTGGAGVGTHGLLGRVHVLTADGLQYLGMAGQNAALQRQPFAVALSGHFVQQGALFHVAQHLSDASRL